MLRHYCSNHFLFVRLWEKEICSIQAVRWHCGGSIESKWSFLVDNLTVNIKTDYVLVKITDCKGILVFFSLMVNSRLFTFGD